MIRNSHLSLRRLAAITLAVALPVTPVDAKRSTDTYVPNELVMRLFSQVPVDSLNALFGTSVIAFIPQTSSYLMSTPNGANVDSLSSEIEQENLVEYCDPNYYVDAPEPVQSSQPFLDNQFAGTYDGQPAATTLQLGAVHQISTGSGITVGVIDGGIDVAHPAFGGTASYGFDFVDQDTIADDPAGGVGSGHGTFVAGVIKLVAPDASIRAYRAIDSAAHGDGFSIAQAIVRAVDDGCQVINVSLVTTERHGSIDAALTYARQNNVLVVAAAGNDSSAIERFPAFDSDAISVTALDSLNHLASFANYGDRIDFCAPGTQIYSSFADTVFAWWNGTSFAAPFVAGEAALLFALNPTSSWVAVWDAMKNSALNVDSLNPAYAGQLGFGLINLPGALTSFNPFICGDINNNGSNPTVADLTYLVNYLFNLGPAPVRPEAANVNGVGGVTVADLTYLVNFLFSSGPPPLCTD